MFEVKIISRVSEEWGEEPDEFSVEVYCEVSCSEDGEYEGVQAYVTSPAWMQKVLQWDSEPIVIRGVIVAADYNEKSIGARLSKLVRNEKSWADARVKLETLFDLF